MLRKTDDCLLKKDSLNDWNNYSGNIEKFPYIRKYLEHPLKKRIEKTSNPLAIEFIVWLLMGDMRELERSEEAFKEIENNLGEDNLRKTFRELETENAKGAREISKKIDSLWAELLAANYLIRRYNSVKRYEEKGGDWRCNNSTIVSVKSKLDLDSNCELIDYNIFSLFCLEENDVIRRYNKVSLMRPINIDDVFINKIISFLENDLSDFVVRSDILMYSYNYIPEEFNSQINNLTVKLESSKLKGVREIRFKLYKERSEDQDKHSMEIYFEQNKDNLLENYYMSLKETDGWWGEPEIKEFLRKLIVEKVNKLDIDYDKAVDKGLDFIGWININLHPRYQEDLMKNKVEIRKALAELLKRDYKVFVSFALSKAFWLEELTVFEIG